MKAARTLAPLLFLLAWALAALGCTDSPQRVLAQRSSALVSTEHDDAPPDLDRVDPLLCPPLASPLFPPDLPASPTVAAGTIAGSFSVSSGGEAIYSMPLVVPPGRAGMQPALAVTYDSSAGEGPLGMGFSVTGLSAITRCLRNVAQDGDIHPVRDDATDALCLDGKRLIPTAPSDPPGGYAQEYRTFPDTFTKVVADLGSEDEPWDGSKGPRSFKAFTKTGLVLEYGSSPSGQVLAKNGVIRSWLVTRVSDRNGNTIDTSYLNEKHPIDGYTVEHAPVRIEYTGHALLPASRAVEFWYNRREAAETRTLHARGMALRSSLRLDTIKMLGPGDALVREYRLSYGAGPATKRTLLTQIRECAADQACKPPTRFTWHSGGAPQFIELPTPIEVPKSALASVMLMDATGDGLDDLVVPDVDMTGGAENHFTNWQLAPNLSAEASSVFFNAAGLAYKQNHPSDPPSPSSRSSARRSITTRMG